jgi:plastocyanin
MVCAHILVALCLAALLGPSLAARNITVSWGPDVSAASISVYAGDRVTWVLDQSAHRHTLTSSAISAATGKTFGGTFDANATFSFAVVGLSPGTYMYQCTLHPTLMVAYLTVLVPGVANSATNGMRSCVELFL